MLFAHWSADEQQHPSAKLEKGKPEASEEGSRLVVQSVERQAPQFSPESCSTAERTSAVHDDAHPSDAKIPSSSAQVAGGAWSHELMQEWGGFPSSPSSPATELSQHVCQVAAFAQPTASHMLMSHGSPPPTRLRVLSETAHTK